MIYLTGAINGQQAGFSRIIRFAKEHHLTSDDVIIVLGSFGSKTGEVRHFVDYFAQRLYHVCYVDKLSYENAHVHHLTDGIYQMGGIAIGINTDHGDYILQNQPYNGQRFNCQHLYVPGESKDLAKNVSSLGDIIIEAGSDVTHILNYLHYQEYITKHTKQQLAYREMRHLEDEVNHPLVKEMLNDLDAYMHELGHAQLFEERDYAQDMRTLYEMAKKLKMIERHHQGISED